jgi:hypothetical protein
LTRDAAGNLYSTAYTGGQLGCFGGGAFPEGCSGYGCGVVFKIALHQ